MKKGEKENQKKAGSKLLQTIQLTSSNIFSKGDYTR